MSYSLLSPLSCDSGRSSERYFKRLLETGEFSDLTIRTSDRNFKVHKAIVSQCAFFEKACTAGFMESHTHTIELLHDPTPLIYAVLQYLYTLDYSTTTNTSNIALFHAQVNALADKYCLDELRVLAARKFFTCVREAWSHAHERDPEDIASSSSAEEAQAGPHTNEERLDFLDAIVFVYESLRDEPGGLREWIVCWAREHVVESLRKEQDTLQPNGQSSTRGVGSAATEDGAERGVEGLRLSEHMKDVFAACPDFALDLLLSMDRRNTGVDSQTARGPPFEETLGRSDGCRLGHGTMLQDSDRRRTADLEEKLYDSDDEQEFV